MKKKLYVISGIPYIMTENSKEFRQDLKLFKQNEEEVTARIALTSFQAFIMRIQILHYNFTHPCLMELTKLENKHI